MTLGRLALLFGTTAAVFALACSSPNDSARVNADVGDRTTFLHVSAALARRCGTIDCHGSPYRNFRIYGFGALRLPDDAIDGGVAVDTRVDGGPAHPEGLKLPTAAEANATYDSLVSLEPQLTRDVLLAHGAGLDNLTLIRKGRGDERHKGGTVMVRGDDLDLCLVGWLSGTPNQTACDYLLNQN